MTVIGIKQVMGGIKQFIIAAGNGRLVPELARGGLDVPFEEADEIGWF